VNVFETHVELSTVVCSFRANVSASSRNVAFNKSRRYKVTVDVATCRGWVEIR